MKKALLIILTITLLFISYKAISHVVIRGICFNPEKDHGEAILEGINLDTTGLENIPQEKIFSKNITYENITQVTFNGLSIEIPKGEENITKNEESVSEFRKTIEFNDNSKIDILDWELEEMPSVFETTIGTMQEFPMEETLTTEYQLMKFLYSQNPEDTNFFDSNKTLFEKYTFLALKKMLLVHGMEEGQNNYFETDNINGFQICESKSCDENTLVQIFKNKGEYYYIISLDGFTQNEIDFIILSAKEVTAH